MREIAAEVKARGRPSDAAFVTKPSDLASVQSLLEKLSSVKDPALGGDTDARLSMLDIARDLVAALETPRETMIRHIWGEPTRTAAIGACVEMGVFASLSTRSEPWGVADLAESLSIQPELLMRLLRHVSAMGHLKEVGENTYMLTSFARALAVPIIGDGYPCMLGAGFPAVMSLPQYLLENGFHEPEDAMCGPLQLVTNTKLNWFEWTQKNHPWDTYFNHLMGGYRQGRPSWMDPGFFPVNERLISGLDTGPDAVLLVDVGGGLGHDLDEFRRKHPNAPGRLILQDLPVVIDSITELDHRIEHMAHDFHTEQPIKGARAYFMHTMLHDWQDDVCDSILSRVKEAMRPGYSKLLINELVMPPSDAKWEVTSMDLLMLSLLNSKERTEAQWRSLLERNGFRVVGIWSKGHAYESLIECEVPESPLTIWTT